MKAGLTVVTFLAVLTTFGQASLASTYVVPVPGLSGAYQFTGNPAPLYSLTRGASVNAHVQFQSITQMRLRLIGTLVQAYIQDIEMGGSDVPLDTGLSPGPNFPGADPYAGPIGPVSPISFDQTAILPLPTGTTYTQWLAGQGTVSLELWYDGNVSSFDPVIPARADLSSVRLEIVGEAVPGTLVGDISGDGKVSIGDLNRLALSWNKSLGQEGYSPACDLTGDHTVNAADLNLLALNWGNPRP